ncbi:MAG TPA: Clp protease N-terminal domain-containing protein [Microlunatus sp.]|nr:Clp protease N-terminal domain-containing protein [Microlunatus sp.]
MFERFTADARAVVVSAQAVARESGARAIDGRHLLLGLTEAAGPATEAMTSVGLDPVRLALDLRTELSSGGLDAAALASVGIDLAAVRASADEVFGQGALDRVRRSPVKGHLPFTADAKKSLELALREAVRLHTSRIDGAMLLLGTLRGTGSPAELDLSRALAEVGSTPEALRRAVERAVAEAS